ncbi:MAG: hypothetical protein LBP50_01230 [Tannerella sp.]|nr:hypothetical protein [Tannerella sp.]
MSVVLLVLPVNDKDADASLKISRNKIFFVLALLFLAVYFVGWWFYFNGFQRIAWMLSCLVAMPPLYYMSLGLWRRNRPLVIVAVFFLVFHIANVWTGLNM